MKMIKLLGFALLSYLVPHLADAAPLHAVPSDGIFAVVLHRGGAASFLSHNHLITAAAKDSKVDLYVDPDHIEASTFRASINAQNLVVDDPAAHTQWIKRIRELDILDEDFKTLSPDDRIEVKTHMLGADQLDAAKFPTIEGELVQLTKNADKKDPSSFTHTAKLRLTVHGQTREVPVLANVALDGKTLSVEATGTADLNDFGITPVSIMLGAIQVLPNFHIYANFHATLTL